MSYKSRVDDLWKIRMQPYEGVTNADEKDATNTGTNHGKCGLPGVDGDDHPYFDELVQKARLDFTTFGSEMDRLEQEMESAHERRTRERGELVGNKRQQVRDRFTTRADALSTELGPKSSRFENAKEQADEAERERKDIENRLGRGLQVKLVGFYPLVFLAVAVLEVPINRYAFEYFFEETAILALLLALGFGFAFAAFAHWTGAFLKYASGVKSWKSRFRYYIATLVILGLTSTAIYFLALMRERYIQFQEQTAKGLGELLAEDGIRETAVELLGTELTEAGQTLLLMNLVVFVVGAFCAYQRHDPDPHYEGARKRAQQAKRKHDRIWDRYEKKRGVLEAERNRELERLDEQTTSVEGSLAEIEKGRSAIRNRRDDAADLIAAHIKLRLTKYEVANRLAREETRIPKAFGRYDEHGIRAEIAKAGTGSGDAAGGSTGLG